MMIFENLSEDHSVKIEYIEHCFTEQIPVDRISIRDRKNYNEPIATIWLNEGELKKLRDAINKYLENKECVRKNYCKEKGNDKREERNV